MYSTKNHKSMSRTLIISVVLITLAVFLGCNSNDTIYSQLTMIDSLADKNFSDSAYKNLCKIKKSIKSDKNKAYYGVLLTRIMHMRPPTQIGFFS